MEYGTVDGSFDATTRITAVTNAGAVILCGGESRRMRRSKAWLPIGNELLLQRTVRTILEVAHPVVVVAAAGQDVPPLPKGVELTRDEVEGQGPLAGLATGLVAMQGRAEVVCLSACDMPLLTASFVREVLSGLTDVEIAVPNIDGRLHPLAGAYRIGVFTTARKLLDAGRRRMTDLFEAVPTRILPATHFTDSRAVANANTPEEYAELLRFAEPIL